jgi:putative FmdB family regulatory protein
MPIYEYSCENCQEEFEVIQRISDKPLSTCPSCRSQQIKKKTSISAFHLKGGGWYKDGYGDTKQEKEKDATTTQTSSTTEDNKTGGKDKDSKTTTTTSDSAKPSEQPKPEKSNDSAPASKAS